MLRRQRAERTLSPAFHAMPSKMLSTESTRRHTTLPSDYVVITRPLRIAGQSHEDRIGLFAICWGVSICPGPWSTLWMHMRTA
jgi:hypothetical protein